MPPPPSGREFPKGNLPANQRNLTSSISTAGAQGFYPAGEVPNIDPRVETGRYPAAHPPGKEKAPRARCGA
ncbi:protein of unknown function [Methanoculleus bourgensis]|uniref:Uncharacterized protein n=1 Tax=Methanoculleus bourgensis TaxID=83986 RepID=A0A0X3BJ73_9EURY|nr:protein of unknown function [Methanoculleus bourgensis]